MKASTLSCAVNASPRPPPAIFMSSRCAATTSWAPSRPARSAESSDLRDHSRKASRTGSTAMLARTGSAPRLMSARMAAIVRYSAWPLMTCPISCARRTRSSSSSSSSTAAEWITMNGWSMPYAPALKNGVCETYSSGTLGQSKVVTASLCMCHSLGNCAGPIRTAFPWNSRRTPRSPPISASTFLMISSTPGMDRRVCSAARSAGCSQETAAIWAKLWRGRTAGTEVLMYGSGLEVLAVRERHQMVSL